MLYVPRSPLSELIKELAILLPDYSEELLQEVIDHHLSSISGFLAAPTHMGLRINALGRFIPEPSFISINLNMVLKQLRNPSLTPEQRERLNEEFRALWRRRRFAQEYKEFKNYKKRFTKWHYKKTS